MVINGCCEELHFKRVLINDDLLNDNILKILLQLDYTVDMYTINGNNYFPKRKTLMYGKDYIYSGVKKVGIPFTDLISVLANEVELNLGLHKGYFNGCLLNLYEDGDSYLSYHKDDEPELDVSAPIVSLSFGAPRKFYLKDDITGDIIKYEHHSGEIIVMCPGLQDKYRHAIPKMKNINKPRVSLTFRRFV